MAFRRFRLRKIKAILDWYHEHQAEADEYLEEGIAAGEKLRQEIESQPEHSALLERIQRI